MLAESLERILREVPDDAVVLDIGGWARPLSRADWVLDLMPYETRGEYGRDGGGPERFTAETWIQRDVCDCDPYPFADDSIDFVVCSHILEDVRDPLWVCREVNRIGRAGYIEVPSRLAEQSFGIEGPWVGWAHHRWLIDIGDGRIDFVMKPHLLHARESDHFSAAFGAALPAKRWVQTLWWRGGFDYRERVMIGSAEIDPYLADLVARHEPRRSRWRAARAAAARAGSVASLRAHSILSRKRSNR